MSWSHITNAPPIFNYSIVFELQKGDIKMPFAPEPFMLSKILRKNKHGFSETALFFDDAAARYHRFDAVR